MIEVQHLNLAFGEGEKRNQVLYDVSFHVKPGEIYGLVGESGSGKTTVLKCLAGLFTHWQGELTINAQPLGHEISRERCRQVQMVFQDPYGSLHPRHTIGDILEEPLQIHRINDRDRRINVLLDKVGLNRAFRERYPHQLSGGQRQRAMIAMVIAQDTDYILLDEPTNNLDIYHASNMMKIVRRLCDELGKTVILVLHEINYAAFYSDYICAFVNGRVAQFGTVEDVISKENLSAIYGVDFEIQQVAGRPLSIYY